MIEFTTDQLARIKEAYGDSIGRSYNDFLSRLTREEWKPEVGEVYVNEHGRIGKQIAEQTTCFHLEESNSRPLSLSEHGPKVWNLVEGVKRLADPDDLLIDVSGRNTTFEDRVTEFAAQLLKDNEIPI